MKYIPELGIAAPELGWVPSPTFAFRRSAILDRSDKWQPGRVLEMGCGAGAILYDLAEDGFKGIGIETSEQARLLAEKILDANDNMNVLSELQDDLVDFDYLLSFEVLEHIEDDLAALKAWVERLRPGGICLLSVPAHPDNWDVTDVMAGHYRRYDKDGLLELIISSGLTPTYVSTYGWPATFLIERLRRWVRTRQLKNAGLSMNDIKLGDIEYTKQSGIERRTEVKLFPYYSSLPGRIAFRIATQFQRLFYRTDRGISYLVEAKK